jgi:hypothetical protein
LPQSNKYLVWLEKDVTQMPQPATFSTGLPYGARCSRYFRLRHCREQNKNICSSRGGKWKRHVDKAGCLSIGRAIGRYGGQNTE